MNNEHLTKMRQAHKVLAEFIYDPVELEMGYANRTLHVDLDTNTIETRPVTQQMKDLWIGGKGFDLWLMFQEINKNTKWNSNENTISMCSGPFGGTTSFPGAGKTIVTAISPLTNSIIDCNVGGYFGPFLKFSGFDALVIRGKAKEDVVFYIDGVNHKITIETAPEESIDAHLVCEELTDMYADDDDDKRNISVVAAGRGAQYTRMGILNFSFYDWRREVARLKQAGRGGVGTVFRDKNIKALVVKNDEIAAAWSVSESKAAEEFNNALKHDAKSDLDIVKEIILKWNANPEYVIEMMQDVQDRERFISKDAVIQIEKATGVPKAELYHIATFYKAFSLKPRGKTIIQVCVGTACHVKGAANILSSFERVLGIKNGETTEDGKYSLEAVACLGACSIAPVVKVGDDVLGNVQVSDVAGIIKENDAKMEAGGGNE